MPRTYREIEEEEADLGRSARERAAEPPVAAPSNAEFSRILARAPAGARARLLSRLPRGIGNAAVARALAAQPRPAAPPGPEAGGIETRTQVRSHAFVAEIRQGARPAAPDPLAQPILAALADSQKGAEHTAGAVEAAAAAGVPADAVGAAEAGPEAAAPEAGETQATPASAGGDSQTAPPGSQETEQEVTLPDIALTGVEEFALCDALWPWLSYSGKVSRGGAAPGATEFGVTRPGQMTLKGIKVRKIPLIGRFLVTATLEQELKWQVRVGTGPTGEVSIGSILDGNLTAANHQQAAADLTPNMSDLNGRPPRTQFWAQDLTERHENFHADDAVSRGPDAVKIASNWLGTQAAPDVPGVQALLNQVPGRAFTALMAAMAFPAREERAYGDGAGAYWRRATGIKAMGAIGMYP